MAAFSTFLRFLKWKIDGKWKMENGRWKMHSAWATALVVLIGLHACAALAHRFVFKDDVLERMI